VLPIRQQAPSRKQDGADPGEPARTLAISSGKGGVGKSSIAVNLGLELCRLGHRVCLFDADTNLANVNILLGLSADCTLQQLLRGERTLDQVLLEGPEGLQIIPAASGITEFIHISPNQQQRLLDALRALEQGFDYLIIDTASGIHQHLIQLLLAADDLLLVITPEPTSLTDAFSLLKVLKRFCFDRPIQVIVNMADSRTMAHDNFKRFRAAAARFLQLDTHYLGYILRDAKVADSVRQQRPLVLSHPDSIASRCLHFIASRLQQRLDKAAAGGLSNFYQQLQLSESEMDRIRPFSEEETGEQPAVPATLPAEDNEGQEDAAEAPSGKGGGLLSATYYASLLRAMERDSKS